MISFSPPPIFSHLANAFPLFSTPVIEMQGRLKYPNCTISGGEKGVCVPNRCRLYVSKVFLFGLVEERAKSFSCTSKQELEDFLPEMLFVEAKVGHISDDPDHCSWCHDHASIDWLSADRLLHRTSRQRNKEMGDWRLTMLEHFSCSPPTTSTSELEDTSISYSNFPSLHPKPGPLEIFLPDPHGKKQKSVSQLMGSFQDQRSKDKAFGALSWELKENQCQTQHQISCKMMQSSSPIPVNLISKETVEYELGEIDQSLLLYLEGPNLASAQEQKKSSDNRLSTRSISPSQFTKGEVGLISFSNSIAKRSSETSMEVANIPRNGPVIVTQPGKDAKAGTKREGNRKGLTSSSEHEGPRTPDAKTLRRLAQNREAARKSRLRKKAYVQQLESSRMKLAQIEQELQRARAQGVFLGGLGDQGIPTGVGGLSSDAVIFDMEYARWLEEHHRLMCELQAAVQEHLPDNELRLFVDNCLAHYDEMISLKSVAVKSDVFHLYSGMWKTPAERCFMWMGGFRPSDLIKVIVNHIQPLTEQQILGICSLQQSTQETEDALSQGLEALQQSLSDSVASDALSCPSNVANYMAQMAIALNKLSTLEGFVRQADNLRQQTLHRINQILTTRQAGRCFLAIAGYFHKLRALSSLWLARPRQE